MNFTKYWRSASPKSRRQQHKDSLQVWLLATILVVCSTALIVGFMPRRASFNYEYELNQPWRYGALYATQKFNIQKSDSAIAQQQDSVRRAFQPYFNINSTVAPAMKSRLMQMSVQLDDGSRVVASKHPLFRHYVLHVASLLDSVYARGVVSPMAYDSLSAAGTSVVRLISDNVATVRPVDRLFSTHSAYQYILNADLRHFQTSMLSQLNINTVLEENASYDREKSEEEVSDYLSTLSTGIGFVMANEKIVDRGEIVTPETYLKLKSYEAIARANEIENSRMPYIFGGQLVLVLLLLSIMATFLGIFRHDYLQNPRCAILLYGLLVVFSVAASLMVRNHILHVFALPCCMVPVIIRVFLDSRTAFSFHICMILLVSLSLSNPYEFILIQTIAGLVAIQSLKELSERAQIVRVVVILTLCQAVVYTAYELMLGVSFSELSHRSYTFFVINGVLLLFAYPLLYVFERGFGFISDVTLMELTNINHPLLQRMTEVAPGTFQHSMQVSNLANEVAKKLGLKAQLVRTGALYHDIGKMERPVFFTENQVGSNPHTRLTPQKSAEVIIRHVTHGLELAEQYNLPQVLRRFIVTHHGRGKVEYFYITYRNQHPGEEVDESLFTYPGPNPATAEEAVLMMCDSVEAASRSLPEYTEESISQLVDRIIDSLLADGCFIECDITFRQISIAKSVLKDRLKNIYHTRIVYPELQVASES